MDPDSSVPALPTPAKHAGGHPKGALGSTTVAKQQAQIANLKCQEAKQKKRFKKKKYIVRCMVLNAVPVLVVTDGSALKNPRNEFILKPVHDIKPRSQGQPLSDNEIATAIKLLTSMFVDALAANNESTYGCRIFEKAQDILGISTSALYKLCDDWNKTGVLPKSKASLGRNQKVSVIATQHAGHICAFIVQRKLEGKVVEVPDVVKFLQDVCIHYIYIVYTIYTSHTLTHIYIHILTCRAASECHVGRNINIIVIGALSEEP